MGKKAIIIMIASLLLILSSSITEAQVTLSVGNYEVVQGSQDNQMEISMDNPSDKVRSIQMDICDVDDYMTCTSCESIMRAVGEGKTCFANELGNGCCRIVVVSLNLGEDYFIEKGTGPIITVSYDVSANAPVGQYRDINLENASVLDENNFILDTTTSSGKVFFGGTIPTLSEWGIIIFMTIVVGIGVMVLRKRKLNVT